MTDPPPSVSPPPPPHPGLGSEGRTPAPEMIAGAFELETAYAPVLHDGLNLADLAHVLDLLGRGVIPEPAARDLLAALADMDATDARDFPYDPADGEPYNSRERVLVARIGDTAGWLHAGRPRREATRIAFRLHLRVRLAELLADVAAVAAALADQARETVGLLFPDQTYLQQAQPSTVAHYLLSFAYPLLRDGTRLASVLEWVNRSPGGAGSVNGTRLGAGRESLAALLGFDGVIVNTRDAMWQTDGLVELLAVLASITLTLDSLAEDLEIWASGEFDFVTLADRYTRSSILMPQKRNPYALSMIRGAAAVIAGRAAGFLTLQKGPSARSDKLIFAYREVPDAVDLAGRVVRLSSGVIESLRFNRNRLQEALAAGYSQATDLADHVMVAFGLDYRSAYRVAGAAVRRAAASGRRGVDVSAEDVAQAAFDVTGGAVQVDPSELAAVLDPSAIVATRTATGGAAEGPVNAMLDEVDAEAQQLRRLGQQRRRAFEAAAAQLRARAARIAGRA